MITDNHRRKFPFSFCPTLLHLNLIRWCCSLIRFLGCCMCSCFRLIAFILLFFFVFKRRLSRNCTWWIRGRWRFFFVSSRLKGLLFCKFLFLLFEIKAFLFKFVDGLLFLNARCLLLFTRFLTTFFTDFFTRYWWWRLLLLRMPKCVFREYVHRIHFFHWFLLIER